MKVSGIYKIQSKLRPERFYIGSAMYFRNRRADHLRTLRLGTHRNGRLQNHYNKYGENDLMFSMIEPCFPEFLLTREQHYIDTLSPYFNICKVAGSCLGSKRSFETCLKIGRASKDRIPSLASRELMRQSSLNRKHSPESCKKISLLKQNQSPETRKKNSEAQKRRWIEYRKNGKDKEVGEHMKDAWTKRDRTSWNK